MDAVTPLVDTDIRLSWARAHVTPLWEDAAAHGGLKRNPQGHLWAWTDMEPLISQAIDLASTDIVERRVLTLANPWPRFPGERGTVGNLTAALQILKPGEVARPHRHTMNALRFVLKGSGASTLVNGKACPMAEGDLVTTPGWTWHEHVHHGREPIIWLDTLDVPLHAHLNTGAFQPGPPETMPDTQADVAFQSAGIIPDGLTPTNYSPLFHYPWAAAAAALERAPIAPDGARRVRYIDPTSGGPIMPMLDSYALEITEPTRPTRSTANAVLAVVEGEGSSQVGDTTIHWGPRDVISLPAGAWITHQARPKAKLFMVTDRDLYKRLDLLKDEMK